jgi:hypothetical protein
VGTPGSLAPPPSGAAIDVFDIGGGCSRFPASPPRGLAINVSDIGGGRSRFPASPPSGPPSTSSTYGLFTPDSAAPASVHHQHGCLSRGPVARCFHIKWWALWDLRHCLPGGPPHDALQLSGKRSQPSSNTYKGATTVHTMGKTFFQQIFFRSLHC